MKIVESKSGALASRPSDTLCLGDGSAQFLVKDADKISVLSRRLERTRFLVRPESESSCNDLIREDERSCLFEDAALLTVSSYCTDVAEGDEEVKDVSG